MKLGIEAGSDTLDLATELGISGVPIAGNSLVQDGVEATLAPIRERNLSVCQIGMMGFNPLGPDESNVQSQVEMLSRVIESATETGCRFIAIGPGNYHASGFGHFDPRNFTQQAIDRYADVVLPLVKEAETNDIVLTVEAYRKAVVHSAQAFLELQSRVNSDRLRCNLDLSSLYDGLSDFLDPAPLIERTVKGLAEHIGLVHLKEIGVAEGFHLKMGLVPLRDGHTDWSHLLSLAAPHVASDGWAILEHIQSPDEARQSVALIRDAAAKADLDLN